MIPYKQNESSPEVVIVTLALRLLDLLDELAEGELGTFSTFEGVLDCLCICIIILSSCEKLSSESSLDKVLGVFLILEKFHIARDLHDDELGDVDLHEDKQLVKGSEDVADGAKVDPLVAVDTEEMLSGARVALPVHDEVACCYGED